MHALLNLWVMPVRGRSPRPALEKGLRPFLRAHPGIDVRLSVIPWGTAWDRQMAALKGRRGPLTPDVLQVDAAWTGTLAALGLLEELTPRAEEVERDGVLPAVWEAGHLPPTRRLFAVPWTLDVRALRVRLSALEETGLSLEALGDWDGWRALARRSAALRRRLFLPRPGGESLLTRMSPWLWAGGGAYFSVDERRPAFLEKEALEAFAFYREVLAAGGGERGEAILSEASLGEPALSDAPWAALPRGPAGRFTVLGGGALALAAGGRHPEEAWRLLLHLSSTEFRAAFAREMGLLSPAPGEEAASVRAARESLSSARLPPAVPLLGSFERLFHRHLSAVVDGVAPWERWKDALEKAARETEILLTHYEPSAA